MATPERWEETKREFHVALELRAAGRAEFLRRLGERDTELAAEVASLVAAHERGDQRFEEVVARERRAALNSLEPVRAGQRCGPYELLRPLGEGGMGQVFLARRADNAFRKEVAIKLVRSMALKGDVPRRFRAERQLLASLDHPGIARLLDGGVTDDGVPFLVMEYVPGLPIDEFCEERGLDLEPRLGLFLRVCDAVAAAHRSLVVHRDIKPSNILVTPEGEPKLLDFGIAKILPGGPAGEALPRTKTEGAPFTMAFAAPEQVNGGRITTATDVHALGLVLYRLLTGRGAYDVPTDSLTEAVRVICQHEPVPPSRAETGGRASRWQRRLRGDLDNIVSKALRKEPERRYSSVEQLSEDIRRHLEGKPVLARKDTFGYRTSKFLGRHRAGAAAALLAALSLTAGLLFALRAARQARLEARKAARINAFVQEILGAASPWRDGSKVTVKEVLDRASRRIETQLRDEPEVEAGVRRTIGETYAGLGVYDAAESQLKKALELTRRSRGPVHGDVASILIALSTLRTSRGDATTAEAPAREALSIERKLHGERHESVAAAWNRLGGVLQARGELGQAEAAQRTAVDIYRSEAPESTGLAEALNDLAVTLGTRGDSRAAEALHREALEIARRAHPGPHPDVAEALSTLASDVWDTRHDAAEAERLYEQALAMRRALFGEDHPDVTWTLYNYAFMLMEKGDYARAEQLARKALRFRGSTLSDEHPMVASALQVLGRCRLAQGDPGGAEPLLRESLTVRRQTLPPGHWLLASSESVLGECLSARGRYGEAEELLLHGYEGVREKLGADHRKSREAALRIVRFYDSRGRRAEADRFRLQRGRPG